MKDLVITYTNENGKRIKAEYKHVFDFTDAMESDSIDIPMREYTDVEAVFWESHLRNKHFETIEECYNYCKEIMTV